MGFKLRRLRQFHCEAVISRLHVRRKLPAQFIKVEIGMQVGENCPAGLDAVYPS